MPSAVQPADRQKCRRRLAPCRLSNIACPKAQAILAKPMLKLPDCWVFPSRPGKHYGVDAYRNAIHRACDRAGIPRWSPNQLRHTAGTAVREAFGLEATQAVLGHSNMKTSEIYAERLKRLAIEAVKKLG